LVDQIKENDMGGACGVYGEKRNAHSVLVRKPEGKRSLGRTRHRLENNIRIDLKTSKGGRGQD
jgi:hypothetical protein